MMLLVHVNEIQKECILYMCKNSGANMCDCNTFLRDRQLSSGPYPAFHRRQSYSCLSYMIHGICIMSKLRFHYLFTYFIMSLLVHFNDVIVTIAFYIGP